MLLRGAKFVIMLALCLQAGVVCRVMAEKDSDKKAEMLNAIDMRRGASLSRQSDTHPVEEVCHYRMVERTEQAVPLSMT